MRFKKDGGLDMRYNSSQTAQTMLIMLGAVCALIAAIIYFIYTYLFVILPVVIIVLQFQYFKNIKTKFRICFAFSTLVVYVITLVTIIYFNSSEPVSIYGSYSTGSVDLEIFKNNNFQEYQNQQMSDNKNDKELAAKSKKLIDFADKNQDSPIIVFTETDKHDYKKYLYYGTLTKKSEGLYETTLVEIYDKYDNYYTFTDGNPKRDLQFYVEEYTWFSKFKGLNNKVYEFELGSIIYIRFILIAGLISIITTFLCYNYFIKSHNIFIDHVHSETENVEDEKI